MPAPTDLDGFRRAITEIGLPSAAVIMGVALTREFVGAAAAGGVYFIGVFIPTLSVLAAMNHWNTRYSAGFVIGGIFCIVGFPSVAATIVPQPAYLLGTLLYTLSLGLVAAKIPSKF